MKYFEKNLMEGAELKDLHRALIKSSGCVTSNLFFHQVEDEADTPEHREVLARSAYSLIGICEAIIDRVPEEEAARALEECRERFWFDIEQEMGELAEKIVRMFGRL